MADKFLLIDGNALAYRAFYALPPLRTSKGEPVQAVYGFTNMLLKIIQLEKPDYIAASFDKGKPTYRIEKFNAYKATRHKIPEDLSSQMGTIEKVLEALGIPIYYVENFEADDCLATLARLGTSADKDILILSGDLDLLQLVGPRVKLIYSKKGTSDIIYYDESKIMERYSLSPAQIIDFKALRGDPSDNIPGVKGIGEQTALKLLKKYHNLDNLYLNLSQLPEKLAHNLQQHQADAHLSRELVILHQDLPIDVEWDACRFKGFDNQDIKQLFLELEFNSALQRISTTPVSWSQEAEIFYKVIEPDEVLPLEQNKAIFLLRQGENYAGLALACAGGNYFLPAVHFHPEHLPNLCTAPALFVYDLKANLDFFTRYHISTAPVQDLKLAAYVINPEANLELSSLAAGWLNYNLPKMKELFTAENQLILWDNAGVMAAWSAKASHALLKLSELLMPELKAKNLEEVYYNIELPLTQVLYHMEQAGIYLDLEYLRNLSNIFNHKLEAIQNDIFELAGAAFNMNSPRQLSEILFNRLKINPMMKTKTGFSTSFEALIGLHKEHPIIDKIIAYRELSKLVSTYVEALPRLVEPATHKLHTSYLQTGTATGRLASSEPNLQNIPIRTDSGRLIRQAFRPSKPGFIFLAADYSQIELRILAHLCREPNMLKAFKQHEDIHTLTAADIFAVPPEAVTPDMRRKAKEINFGIIYGMSAHGLATRLDLTRAQATEFIETYFTRYAAVKAFIELHLQQATQAGFVTTIWGRRRELPDLLSQNFNLRKAAERMAINTLIQGSAADIIKIAMLKISRALPAEYPEAAMLLQVHDELVFELPKHLLPEVAKLVRQAMEGAARLEVPLVVELKAGDNWAELKPLQEFNLVNKEQTLLF